jgi:hypothetical protein
MQQCQHCIDLLHHTAPPVGCNQCGHGVILRTNTPRIVVEEATTIRQIIKQVRYIVFTDEVLEDDATGRAYPQVGTVIINVVKCNQNDDTLTVHKLINILYHEVTHILQSQFYDIGHLTKETEAAIEKDAETNAEQCLANWLETHTEYKKETTMSIGTLTNAERMAIMMEIHHKLHTIPANQCGLDRRWSGKVEGKFWVSKNGIPMCDFTYKEDNGSARKIRLVVQNPAKRDYQGNFSQYAILAQQGHQITWLIDLADNQFMGRVENGHFIKNQPRANQQMVAGGARVNQAPPQAGFDPNVLPVIPDNEVEMYLMGYYDG